MKLSMNGALTIGTEDGANIEMHRSVGDKWWPFSFGKSASDNAAMRTNRSYNPWEIYNQDFAIRRAVDALKDHSLAVNEEEHQALSSLFHILLESSYTDMPDRYFILSDLRSYYETQKKVEDLYAEPNLWAEYALNNIAGMGPFSTDEAVHKYAKQVWDIKPCLIELPELDHVRAEYSEHDKCLIL